MSDSVQQSSTESGLFNPGEILDYAKQVITDPVGFFQRMPRKGGYAKPVVFVVAVAVLTALVQAIMAMFGLGAVGLLTASFASLVLLPVLAIVGSFIGAAILFVIWKLMGSEEDFETAYRCAAYAYGYAPVAALLGAIPYLGTLVQVLWPALLLALATIHVHGRSPGLAYGVFGALGVLALVSLLGAEFAGRQLVSNLETLSQEMEQSYSDEELKAALEQAEKALERLKDTSGNGE